MDIFNRNISILLFFYFHLLNISYYFAPNSKEDIDAKQDAQHNIDIIATVSVAQYLLYCVESYKNLGMNLAMLINT